MELDDLRAGLHAQFRVEVGQRLVEQEDLRLAHDGAAHRHTLALAARQLLGLRSSNCSMPSTLAAFFTRSMISVFGLLRSFSAKAMLS